jgi:hypothetical protein
MQMQCEKNATALNSEKSYCCMAMNGANILSSVLMSKLSEAVLRITAIAPSLVTVLFIGTSHIQTTV